MSKLRTDLDVDDPLVLDASYKIGTIADRRKVDDQIQDLQRVVVDGLISGHTDSFFQLSTVTDPLSPGDVFCVSTIETDGSRVTKAYAAKIALAGAAVYGIATTEAPPGTHFRGIVRGAVPSELVSLGDGIACAVGVDGTTARLVRVPSPTVDDTLVGFCDTHGNINFTGSGTGSGAGGGLSVDGTPSDGDIVAWSASLNHAIWSSRTAFSVTGFAPVTSLVETGSTVTNPAFTASESAPPDTLLLTNNFDSESKDVHATPTSFASSHSRTLGTPGLAWTFTITGTKAGSPASARSASITAAQRTYAGVVAAGSSPATLIAAATFNQLGTSKPSSITGFVGTGGTSRAQWIWPVRYGATPTVKDAATGFGVAYTVISTFTQTNAQGFAESYYQFETVSSFSSSLTLAVS